MAQGVPGGAGLSGLHAEIVFASAVGGDGQALDPREVVVRYATRASGGDASHCVDYDFCDGVAAAAGAAGVGPKVFFAGDVVSETGTVRRVTVSERVPGRRAAGSSAAPSVDDGAGLGALAARLHALDGGVREAAAVYGYESAQRRFKAAGVATSPEAFAAAWRRLGFFGGRVAAAMETLDDDGGGASTRHSFGALLGSVLAELPRVGRSGLATELVLSHADLHPSNVLVSRDGALVAIDFEAVGLAPRALDLAFHLLWADAHPSVEYRTALVLSYANASERLGGGVDDLLWDLEVGVCVSLLLKAPTRLPRGANAQLGFSNKRRKLDPPPRKGPEIDAARRAWDALRSARDDPEERADLVRTGVLAYARTRPHFRSPPHQRCGAGEATHDPRARRPDDAVDVLPYRPSAFGAAHRFNPSAVPLPPTTRARLRGAYDGGDPHYLVAFRTRGGFCQLLCGRPKPKTSTGTRGVLCLYDAAFTELACLDDVAQDGATAGSADYGSYDAFLFDRNGALYATSVLYGHRRKHGARTPVAQFHLHAIDLSLRGDGATTAAKRWIAHPDVATPAALDVDAYGKNLGVVWDGTRDGAFSLLHWLDRDVVDVRRGAPPATTRRPDAPPLLGLRGVRLHHNGSPLSVDDACPGLLLSFGHVHTDEIQIANATFDAASYRGPPPGTLYVHYLVLFRRDPPHTVVATSRAFCFSSLDASSPGRCDIIQFVSGYARAPDSDDILVTYGVNDCTSARVLLPLDAALALAFRNDTAARRRFCPSRGGEPDSDDRPAGA